MSDSFSVCEYLSVLQVCSVKLDISHCLAREYNVGYSSESEDMPNVEKNNKTLISSAP